VAYLSERDRVATELAAAKDRAEFQREQNERHVTRTRYVLHELKQPFASVVMGLDQMDETLQELQDGILAGAGKVDRLAIHNASEDMESTVRIMRSSSVAMHHIITDVLLMAQIEAQGLQLKMRPCTIASAVRGALITVIHQAEESGVQMRLSFYDCREEAYRTQSESKQRSMIRAGTLHPDAQQFITTSKSSTATVLKAKQYRRIESSRRASQEGKAAVEGTGKAYAADS